MPIKQRGTSWEASFSYEGKRYRRSLATHALCAEWIESRKYELKKGITVYSESKDSDNWSLKKAFDKVFELEWNGQRSQKENIYKMRQILDYFGETRPIRSITTEDVDEWTTSLKNRGDKNTTINRKLAGLRKVLKFSLKRKKIDECPYFTLQSEKENQRYRWITDEEERLILEYFKKDREMTRFFVILVDTGMRRGELLNLTKNDVNFTNSMVSIWETKADLPRSIPMTPRVIAMMRWCVNDSSHKLFNKGVHYYRWRWDKMKEELNLKDVVIHTLRHTFASRLAQRGGNIYHIQKLLGHRDISNTMIYAHLSPQDLASCIKLLC
mgnify:FL=1|tara:strand:+ start:578 stop:1555 length:978 start_codon:yes stop_codon:yes gene_type:complete